MNYQYSIVNRKSSIDNWPTGRSAALELGWDLASLDKDVSWFTNDLRRWMALTIFAAHELLMTVSLTPA